MASHPEAISFKLVPITSLLSGVPGSGYLSHAINLYLRCKYAILSHLFNFSYDLFIVTILSYIKGLNQMKLVFMFEKQEPLRFDL